MSLVLRGVATYREVREYWDIDEVYAMQEILDIRDDLEAAEAEKLRQKAKAAK
jgi:hypothetical protein